MIEATRARIFEYLEDKVDSEFLEHFVNDICQIVDQESYIGKQLEFEEQYIISNEAGFQDNKLKHRLALMFEELSEIAEASGQDVLHFYRQKLTDKLLETKDNEDLPFYIKNCTEILDGLVDLQYVLSGTITAIGIEKIFDEAFLEVHKNNMNKMYNSYPEVKRRIDTKFPGYTEDRIEIIPVNGKYILKVDHKIIKPENHKKVKLDKFLYNVQ